MAMLFHEGSGMGTYISRCVSNIAIHVKILTEPTKNTELDAIHLKENIKLLCKYILVYNIIYIILL